MSTAFRSTPPARRPASTHRSPLYPVPAPPRQGKSRGKRNPGQHSRLKESRPPLRAVSAPAPGIGAVKRFPATRALPVWLRLLVVLQRGSLVVAFLLVTATLVVYGSTVYTQQLYGKAFGKLKTQMRNEREMIATNEGLKNQFALQAERPDSGLVPQTPESTIFLQPAMQRQALNSSPSVPKAEVTPNTPLGY